MFHADTIEKLTASYRSLAKELNIDINAQEESILVNMVNAKLGKLKQ